MVNDSQQNHFLYKVAKDIISQMSDAADLKRFAKALKDSLKKDTSGNEIPCVKNGHDIETDRGVSVQEMMHYNILLTKNKAFEFLRSKGFRGISNSTIHRNFTRDKYKLFFDRRKCVTGRRGALLCTYAEWVHWTKSNLNLSLPDELKDYY